MSRERCEGCGAIATGWDADGVPLCDECAEEMLQAAELAERLAPDAPGETV